MVDKYIRRRGGGAGKSLSQQAIASVMKSGGSIMQTCRERAPEVAQWEPGESGFKVAGRVAQAIIEMQDPPAPASAINTAQDFIRATQGMGIG